jgi:hypothetical protein
MEEAKLAILTDAKQEYSHQLVTILKTPICTGIKFLYDESKKKCIAENRFNEVLSEFQDYLAQIRLWSQDMIENEYRRIEEESGCDFIKELITAVFMSHTQILQAIRGDNLKQKSSQNQIDIPKPEHFIHKCYINSGREFYKNPFFFYDGPEISAIERQKNIPQCEAIIANSITETIRQLLPVRRILKTYLQDTFNQEQYDEDEKNESMKGVSQSYQNNLREIVKREIANYATTKSESENVIRSLIENELNNVQQSKSANESPNTIIIPSEVNVDHSVEVTSNVHENVQENINLKIDESEILLNDGDSKDLLFEQMPELSLDEIENIVQKHEEEDQLFYEQEQKEKEKQQEKQHVPEEKQKEKISELEMTAMPLSDKNTQSNTTESDTSLSSEKEIINEPPVSDIKNVIMDEDAFGKKSKKDPKSLKNVDSVSEVSLIKDEPKIESKVEPKIEPAVESIYKLESVVTAETIVEFPKVEEPSQVNVNNLIKEEVINIEPISQQSQQKPTEVVVKNNMDERKLFAEGLEFDEEIDLSDDISFEPPAKTSSLLQTQSSDKKYTFF